MRLSTTWRKNAPHAWVRACPQPQRTSHVAAAICKLNKRLTVQCAAEKLGRRKRKNAARDLAIKARKAKREAEAKFRPIKPAFEVA